MLKSLNKLFASTIARMLIVRILLFSGFITLCISIFQIYDDYSGEVLAVQNDIHQIQKAYKNPLTLSLWNYNEDQVKQIITGISNFPSINFIEITDISRVLHFSTGSKGSNILSFNFPLFYKPPNGPKQRVGTLYIQSSKRPILEKVKNRILIIILSQGIKTFIVSLFIIFLFKVAVTDHLHDISKGLEKLTPEKLRRTENAADFETITLNKSFQNDEIDIVTKKINTFTQELFFSNKATRSLLMNLESLVEKRTFELKEVMLKNENLIRVLIHDIGNPLSGVIFGIDRITKQHTLKEEIQSSKIKLVQDGCDKILEIINFVKDIKSLEAGKKQLTLQKIDLFPIMEKLKEDFSHQLRAKKISLETDYSEKPIFAYAERISLSNSILSNLISNAIKFSHFASTIKIKCFTLGNKTFISIKNFNAPISSNSMDHLFDANQVTSTQGLAGEEGTGFGLPIVKMFAQYNKGAIEFKSNDLETEFVISLNNTKEE